MTTITNPVLSTPAGARLRPFEARRDLAVVADLIELCFADTLDPEGERYLQQMRQAANNALFMRWSNVASEFASLPLNGYVWEEDGRVIGNLSLIPFFVKGRRFFLIANVCTHPAYRRSGIGRQLTLQGIEAARRRGSPSVWLHVRENNTPAVTLYESLGFVERARRTTWFSQGEPQALGPARARLAARRAQHWPQQRAWLERTYPPELSWHLPISFSTLQPGLGGALSRLFQNITLRHWALEQDGRLLGTVTWQSPAAFAGALWLALPDGAGDDTAQRLLTAARQALQPARPLTLEYTAHKAEAGIQNAGFIAHQTLTWMEYNF